MIKRDLVIIGGGSAGMAAAIEAKKNGIDDILILEKDGVLGGILNQCIHNGFGLTEFKEELTGPEYLSRFANQVKELGIEYKLDTLVLEFINQCYDIFIDYQVQRIKKSYTNIQQRKLLLEAKIPQIQLLIKIICQ